MQKIKSIQKGTGEDCIYFTTQITEYQKERIKKGEKFNYIVDEIICTSVDKEYTYEHGQMKEYKQCIVYQGFKDVNGITCLVFEMFNPDLITYEQD